MKGAADLRVYAAHRRRLHGVADPAAGTLVMAPEEAAAKNDGYQYLDHGPYHPPEEWCEECHGSGIKR